MIVTNLREFLIVERGPGGQGRPVCCELWPGNSSDAKTLVPIVDRLKSRFHIRSICVVADRGMISRETIAKLQTGGRDTRFILGARLRSVKEISEEVLGRAGRYQEVFGPRKASKDPAPLVVKEVRVADRRYVICHNEDQARKDRADREAIAGGTWKHGCGRAPRRWWATRAIASFCGRVRAEASNSIRRRSKRTPASTASGFCKRTPHWRPPSAPLKYKELWMVEHLFRSVKSILETRPIYHKCDETIRGHVFCSFLALVLLKELLTRLESRGWRVEWASLRDDLDALEEMTVTTNGRSFVIRSQTEGEAGKALQAAGVGLRLRRCD